MVKYIKKYICYNTDWAIVVVVGLFFDDSNSRLRFQPTRLCPPEHSGFLNGRQFFGLFPANQPVCKHPGARLIRLCSLGQHASLLLLLSNAAESGSQRIAGKYRSASQTTPPTPLQLN